MRYREILNEMPELIDATDFNMMDPAKNAWLSEKLLSTKNREIIEEDERGLLFRVGDREGNVALYDKRDQRIVYWIRFKTFRNKLIGEPVTQIILWRDVDSDLTTNITKHVFFDYLLPKWGIIMSDAKQTAQGRDFWRSRMAQAAGLGLNVGLLNMNSQKIEWFDSSQQNISNWLKSHLNVWGKHDEGPYKESNPYQGLRFVISQ